MKRILTLTCIALALTGCVSIGKDVSAFTNALPQNNVVDVSFQFQTPFWSHQVSATGLAKNTDGSITITNFKDNFAIPLWGTTKTFSVSGLTVTPAK